MIFPVLLGAFVAAIAAWWGWLGWDDEYQVDAAGVASGPYEAWQVIGCGLTLIAAASIGHLLLTRAGTGSERREARRWSLVLTMALGFAGAVFSTWARTDESGLFVIGVVMIFIGVAVAGAVLTLLIDLFRRLRVTSTAR